MSLNKYMHIGKAQERQTNILSQKNPRVLSLFGGAGIMDYHFHKLGYSVDYMYDNWKSACLTYKANNSNTTVRNESVIDVNFGKKDFEGIIGVIGCPPCQDDSRLNKKKDSKSQRGNLLEYMLKAIKHIKPEFVIIENISTYKKEKKLRAIKRLQAMGYHVVSKDVEAWQMGSVQKRPRWLIIATLIKSIFPKLLSYSNRRASEILLSNITPLNTDVKIGQKTLLEVQNGLNDKTIRKGFWFKLPSASAKSHKSFYVINPKELMASVVNFRKYRYFTPDGLRSLSTPEFLLAQGLPKDYILKGTKVDQSQMIANDVPAEIGKRFASLLQNYILDYKIMN